MNIDYWNRNGRAGLRFHLIVRDNGHGLPPANPNPSGRRGIGLPNTQARLKELYGGNHSFSVGKAEPHGYRVDIRFPLHMEPLNVPSI